MLLHATLALADDFIEFSLIGLKLREDVQHLKSCDVETGAFEQFLTYQVVPCEIPNPRLKDSVIENNIRLITIPPFDHENTSEGFHIP